MNDVLTAPLCLPPRPLRNPAGLRLPQGTCDTHFHVFAPHGPLAEPRSYTPQMETITGWLAMADRFGIGRGVLVQPSVYGLDNSVLLAALAEHHTRLRGIVVIPSTISPDEIARLDHLGVRGVRINLRNKAGIGLDALAELAPRIKPFGWHVQFQVGPEAISTIAELCQRFSVNGVIDHLAFMPLDPQGQAVSDMQRALDCGRVWAKISAPYRLAGHNYPGVISALARSHGDRLLWGSDWPHTELFQDVPEDDDLVALSLAAVPVEHHDLVFTQTANFLYWSH
jgi:predicted TIM-barrel fold metal-dependent hydrolase